MTSYENKVCNLVTKSIGNQIIFAYLSLLQDSLDFDIGEIGSSYNITNKSITNITDFIKKSVSSIDKLLSSDKNKKNNIASSIQEHKSNIISSYETLCSYLNQYNILLFLMEDISLQKYLIKNHIHNIDFNIFFDDCYKFLESSDSDNQKKFRISQIIMYLPFEMSCSEYLDYVKKSIILNQDNFTASNMSNYLNLLKQKFNPKLDTGYKTLFPDLIEEIDSYLSLLNQNFTQEKFDSISTQMDIIYDKLYDVFEYISILYKDANYLLLLLSMGFDMEFISGTNPVYIDLYNTVNLILSNNTSELYLDRVVELLNNHLEETINSQTKINTQLEKLIARADSFDDESLEGLIDTNNMFHTYINMGIADEVYNMNKKTGDDTSIDDFIKFLQSELENNEIQLQTRMKTFLGEIPSIFNQDEAMKYIKDSILNTKSKQKVLLAINQIGNMIVKEEAFQNR